MSGEVKLVMDGARMQALVNSPAGVVGRHLIERATLFQRAAVADAPVDTGCLAGSIVKRIEDYGDSFQIRVICDTSPCSPSHTSYALWVHEGTNPHDIPNAFGWGPTFGIGGRFDGKFHPGGRPHRFFTDNLPLIVA